MNNYHCDKCEFLDDRSKDTFIDGFCKKYKQSLVFYDWFEKCDKCFIETLQDENACPARTVGKGGGVKGKGRRYYLYAVGIWRNQRYSRS